MVRCRVAPQGGMEHSVAVERSVARHGAVCLSVARLGTALALPGRSAQADGACPEAALCHPKRPPGIHPHGLLCPYVTCVDDCSIADTITSDRTRSRTWVVAATRGHPNR